MGWQRELGGVSHSMSHYCTLWVCKIGTPGKRSTGKLPVVYLKQAIDI